MNANKQKNTESAAYRDVSAEEIAELSLKFDEYAKQCRDILVRMEDSNRRSLRVRGFHSVPIVMQKLHSAIAFLVQESVFPAAIAEFKEEPKESGSKKKR